MRILSYEFKEVGGANWNFSRAEFSSMNLLVGASGAGKTRFLNTLFNVGRFAVGSRPLNGCRCGLDLLHAGRTYRWELEVGRKAPRQGHVTKERLLDVTDGQSESIVERDNGSFKFKGASLPRLSNENPSIFLLKEEDVIQPIYEGFASMVRRDFSAGGLGKAVAYEVVPSGLLNADVPTEFDLWRLQLGINLRLYFLAKKFPEAYRKICDHFKQVFPFVAECEVRNLGEVRPGLEIGGLSPCFCVKEQHTDTWVPAPELASGMQKVLVILADACILPDGAVYLIDEYENSLGINAIGFFPDFRSSLESDIQFIVTSHHPYLISKVPAENWLVFHRSGTVVKIKHGRENVERYGRSKQQRFVQLINDSFYNDGVE